MNTTDTAAVTTPNLCRCGCGDQTKTTKARYLPGHDARHAGQLARAVLAAQDPKQRATVRRTITKQLSPALQAKAKRMIERGQRIEAARHRTNVSDPS
ncbi:hypothetical protein [Kocuria sp. CPCC 204721]|uniref:hypothetical protein n=1 Tax=Kocuria sp. CPCC 204721 TaxID=3073548 RepID=UPI0034D7923B